MKVTNVGDTIVDFTKIAPTASSLHWTCSSCESGLYGSRQLWDRYSGWSVTWLLSFMGRLAFGGMAIASTQYLSGKLGIATGLSLPEIIREKLKKKKYIIPYWLAAEAAQPATDLAEYLGTVIALNLLFGIPLIYAAIFGDLDVLIILTLATQRRFYIIERLFVIFVSIIGFGYLYEIFITKPDPAPILFHSIIPSLANNNSVLLAVGVIGATVMPHALFVHSWLTKNKVENKPLEERRRIRKLHLVENIVLLTIAGMVNAVIMIMAATAFHTHNPGVASISDAYKTLLPLFGATAGIVFLLTLLSSGIASSVVGTLAGQAIMEGLLGKKVNLWLRRFVTRFINVIPTTIAILLGFDPLNILVYSQVILSIMIPIPMIPLLIITRDKTIMGEFVNRKLTTLLAIIFVGIILVFNSYLLFSIIRPW